MIIIIMHVIIKLYLIFYLYGCKVADKLYLQHVSRRCYTIWWSYWNWDSWNSTPKVCGWYELWYDTNSHLTLRPHRMHITLLLATVVLQVWIHIRLIVEMSEHAGVLDLGSIDQWYDLSGDEQSVIVIWFTCSIL